MKQFLLRLFALIGVLSVISCGIAGVIAWYWFQSFNEEPTPPSEMVLSLDFDIPVTETLDSYSFSLENLLYGEEETLPLLYVIRALENAKDDPKVKGVIARFGTETLELTHAQEILAAVQRFRTSGKFSYAYGVNYGDFGSGSTNYLLASAFENRWMQPMGSVGLKNIAMEAPFGKTALEKLGVKADFIRREEYKSVMESFTDDAYSPPVRANMTSLLADLNEQIAGALAANLALTTEQAKDLLSQGPFTTKESLARKLVTKTDYEDAFFDEVDAKTKKKGEVVTPSTYLYYRSLANQNKTPTRIAMIIADGEIVDDANKGPSHLADDDSIDTQEIVDAFDDAAKDDDIRGIIFRVNSPGGSPAASETIRHALVKAKESKKPVLVSMGSMAASGGYWISMNGDKIFADAGTLTGSIGVVGGKFVLGDLFEKLGIKWDLIAMGDNADMWSMRTPFSPKARERMNAMMDETYEAFVTNVSQARNIPLEKMQEVAKGRVFTGKQASTIGLVDQVGGLNDAINEMKTRLAIAPTDGISIRTYPAPETPMEFLENMLQNLHFGGAMLGKFNAALKSYRAQSHGPQMRLSLPLSTHGN